MVRGNRKLCAHHISRSAHFKTAAGHKKYMKNKVCIFVKRKETEWD